MLRKLLTVRKAETGKLLGNDSGQVLVIGLFVALGLAMVSFTVANVGMMVAEKIHVQDSADAAAYSSAIMEARYMNLSAYINRAIVANYNTMAFNTALWATVMAHDHGLAVVAAIIYILATALLVTPFAAFSPEVDLIGDAIAAVHSPLHEFDAILEEMFSQENTDVNQYVEMYNTEFLSMYQGLLFAAMQSARYDVAKNVAKKMDPAVMTTSILGLGSEAVSADDLAKAVDYVYDAGDNTRDGFTASMESAFDRMAGDDAATESDHIAFLGAVTESSLDKFTAGRQRSGTKDTLRNFNVGNLMPEALVDIMSFTLKAECEVECLGGLLCSCNGNYDPEVIIGADLREQRENKHDETHVPFIGRERMREANFFGIRMNWPAGGSLGAISDAGDGFSLGYSSSHKKGDVEIQANDPSVELRDMDFTRWWECMQSSGCMMNMLNILMGRFFGGDIYDVDEHWDGTFDTQPVDFASVQPPGAWKIPIYFAEGFPDRWNIGVPRYDWKINLDEVGFPHYHFTGTPEPRIDGNSQDGEPGNPNDKNVYDGPSVAVVAVKPKEKINGLKGLGLGNEYDITAISRAQVYFLRNPQRPDELPSTFNPHWAARLAPLDNPATPVLLREGLPYVGSMGAPINPTH